jgi:hypothetical protein
MQNESSCDFDICRANPGKPCLYDVAERHEGVVVEVLRCRRCGRRSIQWMRPEIAALQDAMTGDAGERIAAASVSTDPAMTEAKTDAEAPEPRDYWEAAEMFLKELQPLKVQSMALIALTDDPGVHDVVSVFGAGPFELASMAGVLQMHAAYQFGKANDEDPDDDGEDEEGEPDEV